MAAASSFSSDSNPTPWKYHVFLSFRGGDTRYNFTDHLYTALCKTGFVAFKDDELRRGKVVKHELLQAIEESLFSIVILSQNYASSGWCLDELQKILQSSKDLGRGVLPVFYGIDPSTVRHQTGSFAQAFKRHEERFGEESNKVQSWRNALSDVADLSGYHSKNRPETELIEEIITVLWQSVGPHLPLDFKYGLVGIDAKLEEMYEILEIGSSKVRFVGIWGMGGIGKTTLANLVFNQFYNFFYNCCCLENVREKSATIDGLLGLQIKLLSKIKNGNLDISNLDQGKARIKSHLFNKKVLLLLDDVDDKKQLKYLAGNLDWFGQGSRIIVTTRDMHLLASHDAPFRKYEMKVMNNDESLEFFCQNAFKRDQCKDGYQELSQAMVRYCDGLPLALEVLGSLLCEREIYIWEDIINSIRKDLPRNILDTLRISYEGLEDGVKSVFLDIACFFKGWGKDRVIQILENCGFNPKIGIQILIERSLLKCDNGIFWMHDLLQKMSRQIVIKNSGNVISKQSRLWSSRDINEVLKKNKGTELIEGIVLVADKIEGCWDPNAFLKMCNLRMLIIHDSLFELGLYHFSDSLNELGLNGFPDSLKVLSWDNYPLNSLPRCEELNKLVELKMRHGRIKQLWSGTHNFKDLNFIDLSYSEDLIHSPSFIGVPNLERLILEGCSNLVEIHQSVGQLKKLVVLNLKDCLKLERLPSKLEMSSLKDFILSGCSTIKKLPEFGEKIEGIKMLDLSGCSNIIYLPSSIHNLESLRSLNVSGCSKLSRLPENMRENKKLKNLNLSETAVTEVFSFMFYCEKLESLSFRGCKELASKTLCTLRQMQTPTMQKFPLILSELDVSSCNLKDGSILGDLSCLPSLKSINLSDNDFANLPSNCISNLSRLRILEVSFCPKLQSLPVFPPSLRQVCARNCGLMEALPNEELWKLFMLDDKEIGGSNQYVSCIPGSEIPVWFDKDKQMSFPLDNSAFMLDTDAWISQKSFLVDIPDYCRLSNCKWWGIVVCFLFEPLVLNAQPEFWHLDTWLLFCRFKAPETKVCPDEISRTKLYSLGDLGGGLDSQHQYIILFSGNDDYIQEVLREGYDQLKIFFNTSRSEGFDVKISKCAWRLIHEDEVNTEFGKMASNSGLTRSLQEPRSTEVSSNEEEAIATASNEELFAWQREIDQTDSFFDDDLHEELWAVKLASTVKRTVSDIEKIKRCTLLNTVS